ncbi:unnamed protein product [Phytophthora fragariaefolia]|uniref:Unnamed protein product n=1 Tax=Phytophthora fragariaefolia TaxID=1490495 RepID=A0A9W6XQA4_9STRA|nr:unnamed protein product [Phytophthora fragariaefolia]
MRTRPQNLLAEGDGVPAGERCYLGGKRIPREEEYTDEGAGACHHNGAKRQVDATDQGEQAHGGAPAPSESDTDTSNPDLITGDEASTAGSPAPRATKPNKGEPASANTTASEPAPVEEASIPSSDVSSDARQAEDFVNTSDSQGPKSSASATPPAWAPPPMTPKTTAAVARVEAQVRRESPRDTTSIIVEPEQQIITNAGINEGVPPERLQPDNRRHLSERTQQEASQAVGTKREREASTPRIREQLLALRYWTLDEYREHLRLSRRPGPGVSRSATSAPSCSGMSLG